LSKAGRGWAPVAHTVILATKEAEIRRIAVQSQLRQSVHETLPKNSSQKKASGVAPGEGPEFKPSTGKKKKKQEEKNKSCFSTMMTDIPLCFLLSLQFSLRILRISRKRNISRPEIEV
jgi:hypothetical protein